MDRRDGGRLRPRPGYDWPAERRRAFLVRLGLGLTAAFVVLRLLNVYGDPSRWTHQRSAVFTVLSFLNTSKYPPSLLFLLHDARAGTVSSRRIRPSHAAAAPAGVDDRQGAVYTLVHFPLIHLFALISCGRRVRERTAMMESPVEISVHPAGGMGIWIASRYLSDAVVLVMYPLCRWFAALKQRRREAWLSYLIPAVRRGHPAYRRMTPACRGADLSR